MDASKMLATHGRKALQLIIDRIVAAVKDGDDVRVKELDMLLRQVERELDRRERVAP